MLSNNSIKKTLLSRISGCQQVRKRSFARETLMKSFLVENFLGKNFLGNSSLVENLSKFEIRRTILAAKTISAATKTFDPETMASKQVLRSEMKLILGQLSSEEKARQSSAIQEKVGQGDAD